MDSAVAGVDYVIVALLGLAVGTVELVQRHRDAPMLALKTRPANVYLVVNAAAALLALALIRLYDWKFGVSGSEQVRWTQVLVAGFGAMTLLRSTLTSVRAGGQVVSSGPSSYLLTILLAADDAVGRQRAIARKDPVATIMRGVLFSKAKTQLPLTCFGLLGPTARDEDERQIADAVRIIEATDGISDQTKGFLLGLELVQVVGVDVLRAAATQLADEIKETAITP
jgi:hypothetical protein